VHCACSTVQLLQQYPLPFSWTVPQQSLAERIDYKTYEVIQEREYELWVKKIEEIKQLVEFRQCTNTAFEGKMQFLCFPVLPGIADAHVIWCGIVKRILTADFITNISAKMYQNPFTYVKTYTKPKVDIFLRHGVILCSWYPAYYIQCYFSVYLYLMRPSVLWYRGLHGKIPCTLKVPHGKSTCMGIICAG